MPNSLDYGDFDSLISNIVIDDIAYSWAPDKVVSDNSEFGIRSKSNEVLNNERVIVTHDLESGVSWNTNGTELFTDYRKMAIQAFSLMWSGEAFMTMCMRDHLSVLYNTQKKFWLQLDDEYSYDAAPLFKIDNSTFLTPTHPVGFTRTTSQDDLHYLDEDQYVEVSVNGVLQSWESNPWRLDTLTGTLRFATALGDSDTVTLKYVWRVYTRIVSFDVNALDIAQNVYGGMVVFEQLLPPDSVSKWDDVYVTEDCRGCADPITPTSDTLPTIKCLNYESSAANSTSVTRSGATDAWTGLGNVKILDTSYASAGTLALGDKTYTLKTTGILPERPILSTESVTSITAKIATSLNPDADGVGDVIDDYVTLTNNGTAFGDNLATNSSVELQEFIRYYTFTNLTGITATDINNGLLGVDVGYTAKPTLNTTYNAGNWNVVVTSVDTTTNNGDKAQTKATVFTITTTWIGAGTAPTYVVLNVSSSCVAEGQYTSPAVLTYSGTASADNGLGTYSSGSILYPPTSPPYATQTASSTNKRKVYLVGNVATLTVNVVGTVTLTDAGTNVPKITNTLTAAVTTPTVPTIQVNLVQANVCLETSGPIPEYKCEAPSAEEKTGGNRSLYGNNATEVSGQYEFTGYTIPTDHYITGMEISKFYVEFTSPCAPKALGTEAWIKLKLNGLGDSFSSWEKKLNEQSGTADHAYFGLIDPTTDDFNFGGLCDTWGKTFGAFSASLVNTYGLKVEAFVREPSNSCGVYDNSNWTFTPTYTTVASSHPTFGAATSGIHPGWEDTGGTGYDAASISSHVSVGATWIGAGAIPKYVDVDITSHVIATGGGGTGFSLAADNGLGSSGTLTGTTVTTSLDYSSTVTTRFYIDNAGHAINPYTLTMSSSATSTPSSPSSISAARGIVTSGVSTSPDKPEITDLKLKVWHTPACMSKDTDHNSATKTGTWNTTSYGSTSTTAVSSDGTTAGAFTLLTDTYKFNSQGLFKSTAKIVGIKYLFDARRVSSTPPSGAETLSMKAHLGTYSAGHTSKSITLPVDSSWVSYVVGDTNDRWGYETLYAPFSTYYPTATGANCNTLFQIELLGINISGVYYEFRNMRTIVYYVDVC